MPTAELGCILARELLTNLRRERQVQGIATGMVEFWVREVDGPDGRAGHPVAHSPSDHARLLLQAG